MTFYNVKVSDDVPKTGDGFPTLLIIGLAAIGLVGIGTCLWIRKKL
ncbi:MAG: LPXTG cell wall anchor domain-containing protein [Lachnospiraceae bacterium]|nr:LPXTG cell wall anchor domain-containing protein [Lachnospiraceae bacterium]